MQRIFETYCADLNEIKKTIVLIDSLEEFAKISDTEYKEDISDFIQNAKKVRESFKENRTGATFAPGILMLYVAGRFENFVRTVFEETSTEVAKAHSSFKELDKNFQKSLINDTSKVISNPRKYNHGEGARDTFIRNLYNNIHQNKLNVINYQCLSFTETNMRVDAISDLFKKINYSKIWDDISDQANLRGFFDGVDSGKTMSESKNLLNLFMDMRNGLAHQSDTITWISSKEAINYIDFFIELGRAISCVCPLHIQKTKKIKLESKSL